MSTDSAGGWALTLLGATIGTSEPPIAPISASGKLNLLSELCVLWQKHDILHNDAVDQNNHFKSGTHLEGHLW